MRKNQLNWMIGGPQGSGINASAEVFARSCSRAGLRVYATFDYHSNIMGKHSFYRVRVADEDLRSFRDPVDVLVALDEETLTGDGHHRRWATHFGHLHEVSPGGGVVFDTEAGFDPATSDRKDIKFFPIPLMELIKTALTEIGKGGQFRAYEIMKNTVALGASLALCDYPFASLESVIADQFKAKRFDEIRGLNVRAARLAFDYVRDHFNIKDFPYQLGPGPDAKARILAKGFEIIGIAKLKAGCAFQTYYPISPATDESVFLEKQQRAQNLLVVQCEDEISSINMAVGAAHTGVRASTATSGPGFALMVEGIGFASITEAPGPVVTLYQRGGPSTGMPTRQEQGDLLLTLHPAQGDFPHLVTAPGDLRESYQDTFSAFNWAVYTTIDKLELKYDKIERGKLYHPGDFTDPQFKGPHDGFTAQNGHQTTQYGGAEKEYLRYALTPDGISPRSRPGQDGGRFWTTSDEHEPSGHITEGVDMRIEMMRKRMGKLDLALKLIPEDQQLGLWGPADADLTVVSWGSPKGTILDAIKVLEAEGKKVNFLQCRLMRPFPARRVGEILRKAKKVVLVEENYSGQLGQVIATETGFMIQERVLKFDGRPFSEDEMVKALSNVLAGGKAEAVVTVVR
ncbi:MAG: 2-oxoacid:acceptor oxidoreductase subunit alpha [Chloroflexi bacterium]|nr:2-oxoacid:acceptor oxidoreductase subunit alpha [Chloroflexota bacterium]